MTASCFFSWTSAHCGSVSSDYYSHPPHNLPGYVWTEITDGDCPSGSKYRNQSVLGNSQKMPKLLSSVVFLNEYLKSAQFLFACVSEIGKEERKEEIKVWNESAIRGYKCFLKQENGWNFFAFLKRLCSFHVAKTMNSIRVWKPNYEEQEEEEEEECILHFGEIWNNSYLQTFSWKAKF